MKLLFTLLSLVVCLVSSCNRNEPNYNCDPWSETCIEEFEIDSNKIGRKVLVIGIDGFRADVMQDTITPFLFSLSTDSTTYFTNQNLVQELTFSGPNWSSLCTGVDFCKHFVTTNDFENNRLDNFPHFFNYIETVLPATHTASICNWTPINEHIASSFADYAPISEVNDSEVHQLASQILTSGNPTSAEVLFLQFDELDGTGHEYGFHASIPEYRTVLSTLDSYIENLFSIIEVKRSEGEKWLICIVSDHGGEGTGHSGMYHDEDVRHTVMYVQSPGESFKNWHTSSQVDLAPTILHFLGITSSEFNCKTDGVSLIED